MTRSLMLIIVGALVALSPFSGLPMSILAWILPVLGFVALAIGISYRRDQGRKDRADSQNHDASLSASA